MQSHLPQEARLDTNNRQAEVHEGNVRFDKVRRHTRQLENEVSMNEASKFFLARIKLCEMTTNSNQTIIFDHCQRKYKSSDFLRQMEQVVD